MYKVTITKKCSSSLVKLKKDNLLTSNDLVLIKTWINEMINFGPEYIEACNHWNDHSLTKERHNERSSSFSESGRIIYRVKNNRVEISIIKITPNHDYS